MRGNIVPETRENGNCRAADVARLVMRRERRRRGARQPTKSIKLCSQKLNKSYEIAETRPQYVALRRGNPGRAMASDAKSHNDAPTRLTA
jgi:hypothetical protein